MQYEGETMESFPDVEGYFLLYYIAVEVNFNCLLFYRGILCFSIPGISFLSEGGKRHSDSPHSTLPVSPHSVPFHVSLEYKGVWVPWSCLQ